MGHNFEFFFWGGTENAIRRDCTFLETGIPVKFYSLEILETLARHYGKSLFSGTEGTLS